MSRNFIDNSSIAPNTAEMTSKFFAQVYTYMFIALGLSGAIAYYFGTPDFFVKNFVTETGLSPLFYVIMFAPVGLGLLIQSAYNRLSMGVLLILFAAYSILMGLSLSSIFLIYSIGSIVTTFFACSGAFAVMAIMGYVTKTDLTKMGSLLYMAFIGIFIAGIVNLFMHSEALSYGISCIGVVVFTGLTAYHMQALKNISQDPTLQGVERDKLSLIGGLQLYILFINLFLSLLRLFGSRD